MKITAVASDGKSAQGTNDRGGQQWQRCGGRDARTPRRAVVNGGGGVGATTMGGTANATTRWGRSLFNSVDGYPTDVKVFRNRIFLLISITAFLSRRLRRFSLKTNGAQPTVQSAVVTRTGINRLDSARWISPWKRAIVGGSCSKPLSASRRSIRCSLRRTSRPIRRRATAGSSCSLSRRRTRSSSCNAAAGACGSSGRRTGQNFKADDLNALADHILKPRVTDMDYAQEPTRITLFCVRRDGVVAALTYNRPRNVVGWTRYQLGGKTATASYGSVENVTCIAAPEGDRDDPWLIVSAR